MKTNLRYFAVFTALCLTALATYALPPVYMKFDGIKGETSSAHKETIEIQSWSLGASNPTACATGPVKFSVRGADAESVKKLCQSHMPLGSITVDVNGVKHRFENASFTTCQSGDGMVPTDQFTLNYARCSYHRGGISVAVGDVNGDGAPNARLIGLLTGPVPVHVERLTLNGTSATVSLTKSGPGTLVLSSANNAPLPQVVLEMNNGAKWTFTRVTFGDLVISSATTQQFNMSFTKVEGPPAGFSAR